MLNRSIRHILLVDALLALPDFAAARGSQAGDNGRQSVGADNDWHDWPRQAIPNATPNDTPYRYNGRASLRRNPVSGAPLAERRACRDAVHSRHH